MEARFTPISTVASFVEFFHKSKGKVRHNYSKNNVGPEPQSSAIYTTNLDYNYNILQNHIVGSFKEAIYQCKKLTSSASVTI